ncbi:hypothetical protein B0H14DRAFT_2581770 [Mycena olivaceomarginata]|nr:hypothetical protein B0H14DRAFT_2581770 [Mycena olivaceomarginata]
MSTNTVIEVQNTTQAAAFEPYTTPDTYNPPRTILTPAPATQSYAVPPVAPSAASQSAYSPYTPATPPSTYDLPYSTSVGNTSYMSQKVAVVPPPPAPAPVLNRPKLSNAYDPPFSTSRSTRRGVSPSARSSSPAKSTHYVQGWPKHSLGS